MVSENAVLPVTIETTATRCLTFRHSTLLRLLTLPPCAQLVEDMRPFLLPIFFYAGKVNAAAELPSLTNDQVVALKELRALLTWAMLTLGVLTQPQVRSDGPTG